MVVRRMVVNGSREFLVRPEVGRALVAYLALPLFLPKRFRNQVKFSNRGIAQEMVRALNELGYVVDVINFDNTWWAPKKRYELFVGHAGINFSQLGRQLPPNVDRIYFSTGMYWREANERLATRLHWLAVRRGILLPANRSASAAEEEANRNADGIVCIGNDSVAKSYAAFDPVVAVNNGVYPITWQGWRSKDFDAGRKHFLFFAGSGNVLKGLDLLLEAFRGTDLHLHICQDLEPEFRAAYRHECEEPNVHVYGHIQMRGRLFEELARQCNWVITATCTEGQPGAILECIGHGLIPIMPDSANIDVERDWAIRVERCNVEAIREIAMAASEIRADECRRMSYQATEAVRTRYTPDEFRSAFKGAVQTVVARSKAKSGRGQVE